MQHKVEPDAAQMLLKVGSHNNFAVIDTQHLLKHVILLLTPVTKDANDISTFKLCCAYILLLMEACTAAVHRHVK